MKEYMQFSSNLLHEILIQADIQNYYALTIYQKHGKFGIIFLSESSADLLYSHLVADDEFTDIFKEQFTQKLWNSSAETYEDTQLTAIVFKYLPLLKSQE